MIIAKAPSLHTAHENLARALKQKRAVEQISQSNTAPAIMGVDLANKYAKLFDAMIAARHHPAEQAAVSPSQPATPTFPIEV